jgi:micrococcal nuclease
MVIFVVVIVFKIKIQLMKCFLVALAVLTFSSANADDRIIGKVTSVVDGNTIEIAADDNETYTLVLVGIDCPEMEQEFGDKAKSFTEKLLINKTVEVEWAGKDRWGNRLAVVMIDGVDLRHKILKEGWAWTAERNPIEELELIKNQAKDEGKGLWKANEPTPPWIFRRQQTMLTPKSS